MKQQKTSIIVLGFGFFLKAELLILIWHHKNLFLAVTSTWEFSCNEY